MQSFKNIATTDDCQLVNWSHRNRQYCQRNAYLTFVLSQCAYELHILGKHTVKSNLLTRYWQLHKSAADYKYNFDFYGLPATPTVHSFYGTLKKFFGESLNVEKSCVVETRNGSCSHRCNHRLSLLQMKLITWSQKIVISVMGTHI